MGGKVKILEDAVAVAKDSNSGAMLADVFKAWSQPTKNLAAHSQFDVPVKHLDDVFKAIPQNDLVAATEKAVGAKTVYQEEGTRLLQSKWLDASPESLRALTKDNDYVTRMLKQSAMTEPDRFAKDYLHNTLSPGEVRMFKSGPYLEVFAEQVEKAAMGDKYSTIIADDVSGRLPALFAHDRLQRLADLRGTSTPRLLFIAGGNPGRGMSSLGASDGRLPAMVERIESEGAELKYGRTLLVTDIIDSGRSIKQFAQAFRKTGVSFDVAAMNMASESKALKAIDGTDAELYEGHGAGWLYTGGIDRITGLREGIGVEKYDLEATSKPLNANPESVRSLRNELYNLGKHYFEQNH